MTAEDHLCAHIFDLLININLEQNEALNQLHWIYSEMCVSS